MSAFAQPLLRALVKLWDNVHGIARVSGVKTAICYLKAIVLNFPEIVRSGLLVSADRAMRGRSWPYTLQNVSFELDGRYFAGAREMYCRQVYFPSAVYNLIKGETVVDIGANAGLYSVLAAQAGCSVIAIEAQHGFVREIGKLASHLGVSDRVVVEHALIGARTGVFADATRLQNASHMDEKGAPRHMLEALLAKHGVTAIDMVKIDIEGSEFDLLLGDASWLNGVRRIAMEVHPKFGSVTDLLQVVADRGFRIELRDNGLAVVSAIPEEGGYLFAIRQQFLVPDHRA